MSSQSVTGLVPLALLILAALGIAAAFPLGATAILHGSSTAVSSIRYLTAMVVIALAVVAMRRERSLLVVPRAAILPLVAMGLTVAIFNLMFLAALGWLDPTSGALIVSGAMPIAAALLARWWLGDHVRPRQVIGMVIAAGGVAAVLAATGEAGRGANEAVGGALFVAGGAIWGVNSVLSRIALRHVDALTATAWSVTFGLAVLLPVALFADGPGFASELGPSLWLAGLLGLVSTAIPLLCLLAAIRIIGVMRGAAASFLVPIFVVLLDLVFLNEWPNPTEAAGGVAAIAGFLLITR